MLDRLDISSPRDAASALWLADSTGAPGRTLRFDGDPATLLGSHAVRAALVGVFYFLGGRVDTLLGTTFSPAAIWPPNAVLLTALLLAPVSSWWIYLVAAAVADRAISWPLATRWALGLYASNACQSLIGASLLRLSWGGGPRWRELRYVALFLLCAVLLAPLLAGLAGGAVIHGAHRDVPFLLAWRGWFVSNALTNHTLVPAFSILAAAMRHGAPRLPLARAAEAALLFGGLLVTAACAFEIPRPAFGTVGALPYAPLPFLLCIAMRFGCAGVSVAQVALVFLALHGVAHGRGPFASGSTMTANVLEAQLFLLATTVSLLFLAAAACERRDAAAALAQSERAARRATEESERRGDQVRELAGRLIAAQEEERARIARELHDDLSQRLAAISLGLSAIKRHTSHEGERELARLQRGAIELAEEVRSLSHELHPTLIQHAGLAAALRASCRDVDGRHGIAVTFDDGRDPDALLKVSAPVAICLYRVAQEALRNVVRHSRASRAHLSVQAAGGALHLAVSDDGRGFDYATARACAGVGLASMQERVRLIHGQLAILTQPGRGTEVRVTVPAANASNPINSVPSAALDREST